MKISSYAQKLYSTIDLSTIDKNNLLINNNKKEFISLIRSICKKTPFARTEEQKYKLNTSILSQSSTGIEIMKNVTIKANFYNNTKDINNLSDQEKEMVNLFEPNEKELYWLDRFKPNQFYSECNID